MSFLYLIFLPSCFVLQCENNHSQSHLLSQSHNRSLNKLRYFQRIQKDRVSACAVGLIAIQNLKKGKNEKD